MMAKLETLAMRISEGFQTDSDEISAQRNNLFHRPVNIFRSRDLSYSLGYLRNGLRSIAFLQTSTVQVNYEQIVLALKNHLPLVINVYRYKKEPTSPDFYRAIYKLSNIRCFQFKVSSAAEHLALILVGQRIAEFSLMPVIIYADYIPDTNIDIQVPDDEFIATFLGSPDDQIKSPTPAQEIIFGPTRRRLPNWFSFDNPVTSGLLRDSEAQVFQSASHSRFFGYHLPALIEQSFLEYESLTGIKIRKISESNSSANYLFYSYHTEAANLYAKTPSLMKTVEWLELKQLFPFPDVELKSRLKYKRAVTLLDFSGSNDFSPLHATISTILKDLHIPFYRAQCTPEINIDLLEVAVENMASKAPKQNYYLGIPFSRQHSNFPKHQVLMQQIENKYPAINEEVFVTEEPLENLPPITHDVPLLMRRYQNHGPNFTRQNRFFDDTAIFYKLKQKSELVADPFAALDVVPAATAGFDDQSEVREAMPVFLPEKCTGCGDCFVTCPHAALPPLALGIEKLLRTGSEIVTAKQMTVTRITPMIKNIARTCARVADEEPVNNVSDLLPRAFEKVAGQMQMEGDKLEVAYSEFSAILHELGDFPVAITDLFYRRPEAQVAGSGELFSVVVNPVSCTGCGLCAESCAESAIEMRYLDPDLEDRARDNFHLWEKLPDTSGDTIRRLQHEDEFTSLAAVLLSRNYYMTGIGGTEKIKSGSKKLLHFITALTEAVVQPSHVKQVQEIEQQIESLSDKVHLRLSDALPREDLENLSRLLINAPRKKVHLTDLLNGDFKDFEGSFIDTEELRRKTDLIGDLKAMKWILEEGPGGTGRSRFGLVLAGRSLEWAQEYPFSHFSQPAVFHQTGSVSDQCLGLFKGLLRFHLDHLKILRRAALEAADKYDASIHNPEIAGLDWKDLTDEEKSTVPPVLLVIDREFIKEVGWKEIHHLLSQDYPIKLILMDDLAPDRYSALTEYSTLFAGFLSALLLKNAYIFSGGLHDVDHLYDGLMEGLHGNSPALFHIHVTNFEQHTRPSSDLASYSRLASDSRTLPLLKYNPLRKSDFLRGAIQLENNKVIDEDSVNMEMELTDGTKVNYPLTWADWAYTQKQWHEAFVELDRGENWRFIPEFLALTPVERKEVHPVILRWDESGVKYYRPSLDILKICEIIIDQWRTLQELSGLLFEFPQKLQRDMENKIRQQFDGEAEKLEEAYTVKLAAQRHDAMNVVKNQLKERLIMLSKMTKNQLEN